ncbi:hypothetical protein CR513_22287, partial [Mucuna pruriens]
MSYSLGMEVRQKEGVQKDGAVYLKYCKTKDQLSDIFTKALPRSRNATDTRERWLMVLDRYSALHMIEVQTRSQHGQSLTNKW